MKRLAWLGAGAVALVAIVLIVPAWIDLSIFKSTYLPLIEETIHRRVDVGEVRLSLWPTPSIQLSRLKVSDGSIFPDNTFFAAQQLRLRLKLWPLLRGRFEVTEFALEKPVINLLRQPDGTFNYSDLAAKAAPVAKKNGSKKAVVAKPLEPGVIPLVLPTRMRINSGQLNIETKGQEPVRINGIDLFLQEFSSTEPFPYRASFNYPGLNSVSLEGKLSYREDQASLIVKDNRLKVQDIVLPVEGIVSHLTTSPRFHLSLASDQLDAKPVFEILSIFGLAPRETEISGPMGVRMMFSGPSNNLATQIRGRFNDVKVNGKRALKGNVNGEVFLKLPSGSGSVNRRMQGDGKLTARDGELTNVDLIKKIQQVTGMLGLSKEARRQATTFKTLQADFTIANGLADFRRIHLINPQMEVKGTGTMTLDRPTLNMTLQTVLSGEASSRIESGRAASFFKDREGRVVVPLRITGPVENPSVNLDSEKVLGKGMNEKMEKGLGSFFQQLFRRR
jgi:AsmA protein